MWEAIGELMTYFIPAHTHVPTGTVATAGQPPVDLDELAHRNRLMHFGTSDVRTECA